MKYFAFFSSLCFFLLQASQVSAGGKRMALSIPLENEGEEPSEIVTNSMKVLTTIVYAKTMEDTFIEDESRNLMVNRGLQSCTLWDLLCDTHGLIYYCALVERDCSGRLLKEDEQNDRKLEDDDPSTWGDCPDTYDLDALLTSITNRPDVREVLQNIACKFSEA
mmetsp:Transcript_14829/g.19411  ORF Transcript_14829/g.19411 Transcript_14829/m.19411 type:complete len:164 (+) Transcript_14829:168-659(+)